VAGAGKKFVSWADVAHRYGWTDVTSGGPIIKGAAPDPRCSGTQRSGGSIAFLCATEDGGQSWHRVFQAGGGLTYLALDQHRRSDGDICVGGRVNADIHSMLVCNHG
jgi:hypothetical protein